MRLMISNPLDPQLPVIWNVDVAVGKNAVKTGTDVSLVQFMMRSIGVKNGTDSAALNKLMAAVKVDGSFSDKDLACIEAFQTHVWTKNKQTIVDGKVSVAAPSIGYGGASYTIGHLNWGYRKQYWANWPCIDFDAGCPPAVAAAVNKCLYGVPDPILGY
jgi:hypothetical protein